MGEKTGNWIIFAFLMEEQRDQKRYEQETDRKREGTAQRLLTFGESSTAIGGRGFLGKQLAPMNALKCVSN